MRFFVRTAKGLGGSEVYVRLKNNSGLYWDFVAQNWVVTINANCKTFMSEFADGDPLESLYMVEADVPAGGPWIEEAVEDSSGTVIAFDDNVMGELEAVPTTKSVWQQKLNYIFQYLALRRTATNTLETMYKDDDTTALGTAVLNDDGATFDKDKVS